MDDTIHFNNNTTLGRLEICYNGYWGKMCNNSAPNKTGDVACRQLDRVGQL